MCIRDSVGTDRTWDDEALWIAGKMAMAPAVNADTTNKTDSSVRIRFVGKAADSSLIIRQGKERDDCKENEQYLASW